MVAGIAAASVASSPSAQVAVPYYSPGAFVAALQVRAQAPFASQFAEGAGHLVESITRLCETAAARSRQPGTGQGSVEGATPSDPSDEALLGAQQSWLAAADAWERLEAVSVGPTLERRSARRIDFRPSRPRSIRAAINAHGRGRAPPGARQLERVGAPAKGLPALEWLLWDPAVPTHSAGCRYAVGLAQDVQREAEALAKAHAELAARWLSGAEEEGDDAAQRTEARAAEAINRWMGGLEALRWQQLGKPLAMITRDAGGGGWVAAATAAVPPDPHDDAWPRPPSASHRDAWRARWEALRQVAIGPAPTDGFGTRPMIAPAVISLEALLRGRGRNEDADRWARAVMAADQAMQELTETPAGAGGGASGASGDGWVAPGADASPAPATSRSGGTPLPPVATMAKAAQSLDAVKQFMQATVAPALSVTLGSPDSDGD